MCNSSIPFLLFYIYMPTLVAAFLIGFFIFFSNKRSKININLFIFILFLCFWILNDLASWLIHDLNLYLIVARLSIIEVFSLLFFLFFSYAFIGVELSKKKYLFFSLPFTPFILMLFSDYNIYISNPNNCELMPGNLYAYMMAIAVFYAIWSIKILISHYRKSNDEKIKKQTSIVIFAIGFYIFWILALVSIGNYFRAQNSFLGDEIPVFVPLGMVFFVALLAYAITKYQFLNIKLIAAQALTYSIWILVGSQYFFVSSITAYGLVTLTLLLSIIFGRMLVKTIKEEISRKEELQVMADRLAQANDQLRKLDNAKTEFISIASHQLRTPLTAIKGFLSLVIEGSYGEVNPQVHGALDKTYAAAERLVNLVEDLLNISRMEAGRMEYKFEKASVVDLLQELYDNFILAAKRKKLKLELKHLDEKVPEINMDRSKVREVLSNVIDNAIKYTDKGGVKIKTEIIKQGSAPKKEDSFPSTEKGDPLKGDILRISVSDTGIGIPETEMAYLFKKFSRGKDIARLNAGGTGLGIYVGKSMMEAHHGRIWAQSEGAGKGSSFVIELPLSS